MIAYISSSLDALALHLQTVQLLLRATHNCSFAMGASWLLLHGAALMILMAAAAAGETTATASIVVGAAKCAGCGRKNMDAETAFKGKYECKQLLAPFRNV